VEGQFPCDVESKSFPSLERYASTTSMGEPKKPYRWVIRWTSLTPHRIARQTARKLASKRWAAGRVSQRIQAIMGVR